MPLIKSLNPSFAVSPIEQFESNTNTGKKKIARAQKHGKLAFNDCVVDPDVKWIFPVVLDAFENENLSQFVGPSYGVIAYGGGQMNKASKFDSLRQLFA